MRPFDCSKLETKSKRIAASVDRTQYLQKSHVMQDSSELQSGALPGELKRLIHVSYANVVNL
jgi:hypothetical protein